MSNQQKEDGYSLVETLVAMAILLAVLIPSVMFLTYIGNNHLVRDKVESYQIARNEMEQIIATKNDSSMINKRGKWLVKRTISNTNELHYLAVEVFKKDTLTAPIIRFETARIWNKN